jgi:hypothetical protein
MPQRASQRKFGKILKLRLAKQKKQKLEETCRKEKCRTFVLKKREEKASGRTMKKLLICLRMCELEASVRNRKQEAERASQNQECQENKRCKQKGKVFPQLTNSMVLAN